MDPHNLAFVFPILLVWLLVGSFVHFSHDPRRPMSRTMRIIELGAFPVILPRLVVELVRGRPVVLPSRAERRSQTRSRLESGAITKAFYHGRSARLGARPRTDNPFMHPKAVTAREHWERGWDDLDHDIATSPYWATPDGMALLADARIPVQEG